MSKVSRSEYIIVSRIICRNLFKYRCFGKGSLYFDNLVNPYGFTKMVFEQALRDYCHAYGIGYAALRYFNAAGASPEGGIGEDHQPESHLIPIVLQVALGQRDAITIFGDDYSTPDGTCIRDYIHVDDLASAHLIYV